MIELPIKITKQINVFIHKVRILIIMRELLFPLIPLCCTYIILELCSIKIINLFRIPVNRDYASISLIAVFIVTALTMCFFLIRDNLTKRYACRFIDEMVVRLRFTNPASFEQYVVGSRAVPPTSQWIENAKSLHSLIVDKILTPRKVVSLWPRGFVWWLPLGTAGLISAWGVSLIIGSHQSPGRSEPKQQSSQHESPIEKKAAQTRDKAFSDDTKATAESVRVAAEQLRKEKPSLLKKQNALDGMNQEVQDALQKKGGGRLSDAFKRAGSVLCESPGCADAGKALRDGDLENASERFTNGAGTGQSKALAAALDTLVNDLDSSGNDSLARALSEIAEAMRRGGVLSQGNENKFRDAFSELHNREADARQLQGLARLIENERERTQQFEKVAYAIRNQQKQMQKLLENSIRNLGSFGDNGAAKQGAEELRELLTAISRGKADARETTNKTEATRLSLIALAEQCSNDSAKQKLLETAASLKEQEIAIDHNDYTYSALSQRGSVSAISRYEDFQMAIASDSNSVRRHPEGVQRRVLVQQESDRSVPRTYFTRTEQSIKEVIDDITE
jgi:hypothetical protein